MGSRYRENVRNVFECFCEIVCPKGDHEPAWILQKFPESYKDEEVLRVVPKFAFPCEFDNSVVQHYSFVLTSADSKWMFGFCRHNPKSDTSFVVLSYLPWHEQFYKFLNFVSDLTRSINSDELWSFLNSVYRNPPPDFGHPLQVSLKDGVTHFVCTAPAQFQLPRIPENRNLTEYYNAVDTHNMMIIFASMLYERRIIFVSKKLYRLSACVQSANGIIYPMNWQHIFIPVLPKHLIDYLLAPMPYLIGLPESLLPNVRRNDLGEVVILNADTNTVETPFDDLESLPQDVVNRLRRQLKNRAVLLGDGVSRAFLQALVQLIGGYRDGLRFQQGQEITFNPEAFINSRPASMQPFLRKMLHLQIFQQFIEERLELLNAGLGFSDEFEMEACSYMDKTSSRLKQQYKEWTFTIKRDSTAFLRSVKNRANPAVKSAVKTVKERGRNVKTAYRGIRSKLRDPSPVQHPEPRSAPGSPTESSRVPVPTTYKRERHSTGISDTNYTKLTSPTELDDNSQYPPLDLNINLMDDLQDVIFNRGISSSKLVRSLENLSISNQTPVDKDKKELASSTNSTWYTSDDVFLATPPTLPPRKNQPPKLPAVEEANLIQLNSTSSMDDFDPLLSGKSLLSSDSETATEPKIVGLINPLYPYFTPKNQEKKDNELLSEYGINFNSFQLHSGSLNAAPSSSSENSQNFSKPPSIGGSSNFESQGTHSKMTFDWTTFD
ncbi:unnamed protein product [Bemisia tabaci]|uniref:UDENN domain-containing protein n=1 Tax=Bemisia tabaci TaxID=7038 RepID=A0A9P0F0P8_BEMTA|nr:unnamed protein product [Bemisia tabaci]